MFKYSSILLILFLTSSCGVKSPPRKPEGTSLPSIIEPYKEKFDKEEDNDSKQQQEEDL